MLLKLEHPLADGRSAVGWNGADRRRRRDRDSTDSDGATSSHAAESRSGGASNDDVDDLSVVVARGN